MSDLPEDSSRILAYEQIITWEGVQLYWCITPRSHQGHFKVKKNGFIHFLLILSLLVVQSSARKDRWWHILGRVSFQQTFLEIYDSADIGRGNAPMFALITPPSSRLYWTSKITIMQQRVASAWVSIAKDWYMVGYEGWHDPRLCFTAWIPLKRNVKVISRSCKMSRLSVYGWCVLNA